MPPIISIVTATEVTEPYWGPFQQKGCNRSTLKEIQQQHNCPKDKRVEEGGDALPGCCLDINVLRDWQNRRRASVCALIDSIFLPSISIPPRTSI